MVIWLLACASPVTMTPERQLARLSMDLRGVRPSVEELDTLESDRRAIEKLTDTWLHDPRFGAKVADLYALRFRTRLDHFTPDAAEFGLPDEENPALQVAIGDEPLRIIAWVADHDLPYTDVVTMDATVVDETLAQVWPVEWEPGATGQHAVRWTDGRPAAGVLTSNGLWWRYTSTMENYNRGRANAVSRILLCDDFLRRPVTFPRTDAAPGSEELLDQTQTDPSCTACHFSLDPLGSFFYGFTYFYESYYMTPEYNEHAEARWQGDTEASPAYFGQPGGNLADLGQMMAADPRFIGCAVETIYGGLLHREVSAADQAALTRHREAFIQAGVNLRALVGSVVRDDAYLGAAAQDRMVPVELLASTVEDITGFRWTEDGYDLLTTDRRGYRPLAGGFDGAQITGPVRTPNPTVVLVQSRLSELAGPYAAEHRPRLFQGEGWMDRLARRTLTRSLCDEEADALAALWEDVAKDAGEAEANGAVLTALLRHPDFLVY